MSDFNITLFEVCKLVNRSQKNMNNLNFLAKREMLLSTVENIDYPIEDIF